MVDQAIKWNIEAYHIRLAEHPPKHHLIASFENNLGYCYNTANNHTCALEYFRKALNTTNHRDTQCLLITRLNKARCLFYLDRPDEAKLNLLAVMAEYSIAESLDWAMSA